MRGFSLFFALACSADPKLYNSNPEATITSHDALTSLLSGYEVNFRGQASDPNNASTSLQTRWLIDSVPICGWEPPDTNGASTCTHVVNPYDTHLDFEVKDPFDAMATTQITLNTVLNQGPVVEIIAPTEDEVLIDGQSFLLIGRATDEVDSLEDMTINWHSNIDGLLNVDINHSDDGRFEGTGEMSVGTHTLTLSATDSIGEIGQMERSVTVWPINTPPRCGFASVDNILAIETGSELSLTVWGADSDPNAMLNYTLESHIDGTLSVGQMAASDSFTWSGHLSPGLHQLNLELQDERGGTCLVSKTAVATAAPWVEIDAPTTGTTINSNDLIVLAGTVTDSDQSTEALHVSWHSSTDGTLFESTANANGQAIANVQLSPGPHDITLTATDIWGISGSKSTSIYINQAPLPAEITIAPTIPNTLDTIEATAVNVNDPDGDPLSLHYFWYKNGIQTNHSGSILSSTATNKGDIWELQVFVDDSHSLSPPTSLAFTIANTPPSISSVQIIPTSGIVNSDTIQCTATAVDPDEIPIIRYEWRVQQGPSEMTVGLGPTISLNPTLIKPGQMLTCRAIATDADGAENTSETVVAIDNRSPMVIGPSIIPASPHNDDELLCDYLSTDPDGDLLMETIVWTNEDRGTTLGISQMLTLDSNQAMPGETIRCQVSLSDPLGMTETAYAEATLSNREPTLTGLSITPQSGAGNNDALYCDAQAEDSDNDSISMSIEWLNLSTGQLIGNGAFLQLSPTMAIGGDMVQCRAHAEDTNGGVDNMEALTVIDNSPPEFVQPVQITPTSSIEVGDTILCLATIEDSDGQTPSTAFTWHNLNTGELIGLSDTLQLTNTMANPDDLIQCQIEANDNFGGISISNAQATVENSLPTVSQIQITPATPRTTDSVDVSYQTQDANSDPVSVTIEWTVNGILEHNGQLLPAGQPKGAVIDVWLTPNDGRTNGIAVNLGAFAIANTPPTPPMGEISPGNPRAQQDTLTCSPLSNGQDIDNDTLTHSISWKRNGATYVGQTQTLQYSNDQIPASETQEGESWQCIIHTNDGDNTVASAPSQETVIEENCFLTSCDYPAQGLDFITISPAIFMMGSAPDETGRSFDETQHLVEITKPYGIMTTEVTQSNFTDQMGYNPSTHINCADCPVETVSWDEAVAFANQISIAEGLPTCYTCTGQAPNVNCLPPPDPTDCSGYRLPTEAEWENAIRAASVDSFWTYNGGSNILYGEEYNCASSVVLTDGSVLGDYSWYCQNNAPLLTPDHRPKSVGQKWPNGFGIYDGYGNVWEWTHDFYEGNLGFGSATDPSGSLAGYGHTCRGGGYDDEPRHLRAAERKECVQPAEWLGFRIAITEN